MGPVRERPQLMSWGIPSGACFLSSRCMTETQNSSWGAMGAWGWAMGSLTLLDPSRLKPRSRRVPDSGT